MSSTIRVTVAIALMLSTSFAGETSLNFLVLGDWGGIPVRPYHSPGQVKTAVGMGKVASAIQSDFVIAVGDNFYFDGVEDEDSIRFDGTWNDVYTDDNLQTKWYVIAGNHDHHGNVSAQIAYTDRNDRWTFPSSYHSHSFVSNDGSVTVDMIMIDTVDLASMTHYKEDDPRYFEPLKEVPRNVAEDQWSWIEDQMKKSTADYLIVAGHYPVYSVCSHGPTQTMITNLKPLLEQYGAHYLSGHDHCLEHLSENGVNYMLSGIGDDCCYKASNTKNVPEGVVKWYAALGYRLQDDRSLAGGFGSISASKSELTMTYHDQDGEVLFTADKILPRAIAMKL